MGIERSTAGPDFAPARVRSAPRPMTALKLLRVMVENPVAAIPDASYERGFVRSEVGGGKVIFLSDPDLIETVLLREQESFPKSDIDRRVFEPLLGRSLLTLEHQDWRWQRRLAAPAFRHGTLTGYLPAMRGPFDELVARWRVAPGPRDMHEVMTSAALEVVCRAFFSGFDQLDAARVSQAIGRYLAPVSWTIAFTTMRLPAYLPHPGSLRMARAVRECRTLVGGFVQRRRGQRQEPPDLGQALIDAADPETGRRLNDTELTDLFLTLVAAGHETSANGLTWALYCLAAQPDRQEALAEGVREVTGNGPVEASHMDRLDEVRRFIEETMRLFPPVPIIGRRAMVDVRLGDEDVAAGSLLFLPVYATHHHRALWPEPDRFDPSRFLTPTDRTRPRCAYMPFGAGPRICVGASFAMLEMVVGLATLLRKVRVRLVSDAPPEPVQRITLRPRNGLILHVEARAD